MLLDHFRQSSHQLILYQIPRRMSPLVEYLKNIQVNKTDLDKVAKHVLPQRNGFGSFFAVSLPGILSGSVYVLCVAVSV